MVIGKNTERVNAAVKIRIAWERAQKKEDSLYGDLKRIIACMSEDEWHEYQKRILK